MEYDLICVGGGLGGAGIAGAMAARGARTLVLERETRFRDRVRGEYLECWGVAEARALGLESALEAAGAHRSAILEAWFGSIRGARRDFADPAAPLDPPRCVGHPALQEAVLAHAAAAGAEVRRGATVTEVVPGKPPAVRFRSESGAPEEQTARLVVGADGRDSKLRRLAGFTETRDENRLCLAGVLLDGYSGPDDTSATYFDLAKAEEALLFPQGNRRLRAYVAFRSDTGVRRLSGKERLPDFLRVCGTTGVPSEWLAGVQPVGPLAAFEGADSSVAFPYRDGVVLVGDAAATSDPVWGCGMSLTLRDVRVLRDALLASSDWDAAAHAYAEEHDRYYSRLHTLEDWMATLFFDNSPEGETRRARLFAKVLGDTSRLIDIVGRGPDQDVDERARRHFFGED